jgi:hypothetical protein
MTTGARSSRSVLDPAGAEKQGRGQAPDGSSPVAPARPAAQAHGADRGVKQPRPAAPAHPVEKIRE